MSWLNSDDIYLPGAIHAAVAALAERPDAGAVYGEGYQIDEGGAVISRFASTQQFDLWRLLNLSDYILQQTVFFRRSVFDEVGWLDEDLHYGMDWEILMRIGLRRPLAYVPHEMGAIREYPTAKSFAGGAKRASEIARILRRHTGKSFPPGMFVYGLPTYEVLVNRRIERVFRGSLAGIGARLQRRVTRLAHGIVGASSATRKAGTATDGSPSARISCSRRPKDGASLCGVSLPEWTTLSQQEVTFYADGREFARQSFGNGEHTLAVDLPASAQERPSAITLRAKNAFRPRNLGTGSPDERKLCYLLHAFDFERASAHEGDAENA